MVMVKSQPVVSEAPVTIRISRIKSLFDHPDWHAAIPTASIPSQLSDPALLDILNQASKLNLSLSLLYVRTSVAWSSHRLKYNIQWTPNVRNSLVCKDQV